MSLSPGRTVFEFLKLGRPKFLLGGLLFYGLGAALAVTGGAQLDLGPYLLGQLVVSTTQWMTHYSNDYFDLAADRANSTPTRWSGGSRVLVSGAIPPVAALVAALVLAAGALTVSLLTAWRVSSPRYVLPITWLMIALSWSYSAPPLRLLSRGLGELTTAVVVTLLTPLLGFYLQSRSLAALPLLASAPLCALQFAMLLTIELPDAAGDAALGKRTLVVRFGATVGAQGAAGLVLAAFVGLALLAWLSEAPRLVFGLPLLLVPLAAWHGRRLLGAAHRDPRSWESLASSSVALLALTAGLELAAALWLVSV